jgi:hypothetical protein
MNNLIRLPADEIFAGMPVFLTPTAAQDTVAKSAARTAEHHVDPNFGRPRELRRDPWLGSAFLLDKTRATLERNVADSLPIFRWLNAATRSSRVLAVECWLKASVLGIPSAQSSNQAELRSGRGPSFSIIDKLQQTP